VNPYQLTSEAAFGEITWRPNEEFSLIGGLRYTHDHKLFHNNDSAGNLLTAAANPTLLQTPGFGYVFTSDDNLTFNELTGRLVANWTPHLSFTDRTLIYASYSRGYKGGGFNPPNFTTGPSGSRALPLVALLWRIWRRSSVTAGTFSPR